MDERQDSDAIWNLLIEEYNNRLRWYVIYTEIRPLFDMSMNASRLKALGFEKRGHYNLLLDIGLGKEQVWVNMHKKRRKNIKHAINAGLSFQEVFNDEEIMKCVKLLQQTYVRKRVPLSDIELFTNAKFCLGENAHWFGAYYEGQMIACKLSLSYKNLIIAWYGGSDDAYFKQCPNDFLTWEVLCWSIDNGYTSYDFGGGGEPGIAYGVRDYKLKFGCKIYDFGRYLLFHKPLLYKLADFFVKLLKIKKS